MTWKYFVLGREKTPLPNCEECRNAREDHDREACNHLTCHGFYAATDVRSRLNAMASLHPYGHWAVRTGEASGIIVIDAEGGGEPSGIDVLDSWESWVGGWELPPTGLIASTPSGGRHLFYEYAPGVRSRNRVLPNIDVKSDGGYVLIPMLSHDTLGREWVSRDKPGVLSDVALSWLRAARGRGFRPDPVAQTELVGYSFDLFLREGCPGGMRDEFFNELIFRLRKSGLTRDRATVEARYHWNRAAQPPDTTYYMPFHHVEYKIERIWRTVRPDSVAEELRAWAVAQGGKFGRVTLAPGR